MDAQLTPDAVRERIQAALDDAERVESIGAMVKTDDLRTILAALAVPAGEVRLQMFLDILSAAGGTSDCSEWPGAWTNAFCGTHEGQSPDTFNTAIDKGYTWSTYDADRDHGTVTLTAAGRAYLASLSHGEAGRA